jgi:hypothetical protein
MTNTTKYSEALTVAEAKPRDYQPLIETLLDLARKLVR